MNIFFLDEDPIDAAQQYCDQHVNKIQLEICQMVSTAFHLQSCSIEGLYKTAHINHPTCIWVRESQGNLLWVLEHLQGLIDVWVGSGHNAPAAVRMIALFHTHISLLRFATQETTPVRLAMWQYLKDRYGSVCSMPTAVQAYRAYYCGKVFNLPAPLDRPVFTMNKQPEWYVRTEQNKTIAVKPYMVSDLDLDLRYPMK